MLQLTFAGTMQLQHAIFWAMCAVMAVTCTLQIKYLNQVTKHIELIRSNKENYESPFNLDFFGGNLLD